MSTKKTIMFVMTLMVLIIGISAISAADLSASNTTHISADSTNNALNTTTTQKVVDNSDIETSDVITQTTTKNTKTDVTQNNKNIKSDTTHIVNQDNWGDSFTLTNDTNPDNLIYSLSDSISNGDTLDFQGNIAINATLKFDKQLTVTSTTNDANITLNTTAGSLMGDAPGHSFWISEGAKNSEFSNIYLYNTQFWVQNTTNVTFNNMSMVVSNQRVGSGVGQTAIRASTFITLNNCFIYTENNGGSSSFVITKADYCTINNCTIQGAGQVGNLVYINIYNAPANTTQTNSYNNITNNTLIGPSTGSSICNGITLTGSNNIVSGNKLQFKAAGITSGWGSTATNETIINNELNGGCSLYASSFINSTIIGNTLNDNGILTSGLNAIVENNTAGSITVSQTGAQIKNNIVKNTITVNQKTNNTNNTINNIIVSNANAANSNITFNNITGTVTITKASGLNISDNTIVNNADYTISVATSNNTIEKNYLTTATYAGIDTIKSTGNNTIARIIPEAGKDYNITDETYNNFFDENGVLNDTSIPNYSKLYFIGEFNNKNFTFKNIIINVLGVNATFNNSTITSTENAKIAVSSITINNKENNDHAIVLESNGNIVRNNTITHNTIGSIAQEIYVNGENNTIQNNNIEVYTPSTSLPWGADPAVANVVGVVVLSNDNIVSNNNINITSTTSSMFGTSEAITVQASSKNTANNNQITNNNIKINGTDYIYGINIGDNTYSNNVQSNTINIDSNNYASGIQIGYGVSTNNKIQSNTINLNSNNYAYGLLISVYGNVNVTGNTITSNTVNAISNQTYLIEGYSSTSTSPVSDITISNNKLTGVGNYTMGIALVGENIAISGNTLTITGATNETVTGTYDMISPTTAGILLQNSKNITLNNKNIINIVNGSAIKLMNTKDSTITTSGSNYVSNNTAIVLINSNNNNITSVTGNTTSKYSVTLTNSSNNYIVDNSFNANNLLGGDDAVFTDISSADNTIENNTPRLYVLTNETYSALFDENGNYLYGNETDILSLASDLNGVNLTFDKEITFVNSGSYIINNGTIKFIGNYTRNKGTTIDGINIFNINQPAIITDLNNTQQLNFVIKNGDILVIGDNITAIVSNKNENVTGYNYMSISNQTIVVLGENATAISYSGVQKSNPSGVIEVLNSNIGVISNDESIVVDAKNCVLYFKYNNVTQSGKNVVTILGNNAILSYSNGFQYNNVYATGDNVEVLNVINKTSTSSSYIYYNNLTLNSSNPITAIILDGSGNYVEDNIIIANSTNNGVPVIDVAYGRYCDVEENYIQAVDVVGDDAVNDTGISISDNTPANNTGYMSELVCKISDDIVINKASNVSAIATDVFGNPIIGIFTFYYNGEKVGYTIYGTNASFEFTPLTSGNTTVKVVFSDLNGKYDDYNVNYVFTVDKLNTTPTLNTITGVVDEVGRVTTTIIDSNGDKVNSGRVVFSVNGKALTDSEGNVIYVDVTNGIASLNYTVPLSWLNSNATVTYYGNDVYEDSNASMVVVIDKRNATVELEITNKENIKPGTTIDLMAVVSDMNGTTINNGYVVFKINGVTLKDANGSAIKVKVENGVAMLTYTIPSNYSAKNYTVSVVYGGNAYNRAEDSEVITVQKVNTYIQSEGCMIDANNTITIKGTIYSVANNEPVTGTTKVTVKIDGKTIISKVSTINGKINITVPNISLKKGIHNVTIIAGENSRYNQSSVNTYIIKTPVISTNKDKLTLIKA